MSKSIYTIYCATNLTNNKKYVGYTSDFNTRKHKHIFDSQNNPKTHFHKALNRCDFSWEILHEDNDKSKALHYWEEYYIRKLNTYALNGKGYNYSYGGDGAGHIKTKTHRRKISETNKRLGISFVNNGATEAARIANTGKKQTRDHILKRAKAKCRSVEIEGVIYSSQKEAALKLNVSQGAISGWISKNGGDRMGVSIPKGSNQYVKR